MNLNQLLDKGKMLYLSIIVTLSCSIIGCTNSNIDTVDYEVLVVPETFKGVITVFYEQDKNLGRCEFRDGKHYFYVDTSGVFFTKAKMGEGRIESLAVDLKKSISVSPMSINEETDVNRFVVVGGDYRGFKTTLYKEGKVSVRYTVHKAGKVKTLKDGGWYVSDSLVDKLYEKFQK
jgi:hypothetical protein